MELPGKGILMHCEWCGQETKGHAWYGRVLCVVCYTDEAILLAVLADYERRRARGW